MIVSLVGFVGYSISNRSNINFWGRRSLFILAYSLVICCFAAARDGLDKTIQYTIDGSCNPGIFSLVSVPNIVGCVGAAIIIIAAIATPIAKSQHMREIWFYVMSGGVMLKFLECSDDFSITTLRFSSNFFNEIYPTLDGRVIEVMPLSAPDLYTKEGVELLDLIFRQLCCLHERQEYSYKNKILIHLVISYIFEIYEQTHRHIKNRMSFPLDHKSLLLDKFYCLCCEEHLYHRNIEYYAEKLNITSRYLYKLCQESFHMTPKQCIDYIISGNAKKMLLSTELSTQQIANELNFSDQSAFGQFFKRNVGMSPTDFRNKFK